MLTVRQSNALVELNKAIEAAKEAGLFDSIKCTDSVVDSFSTEMLQAENDDNYRDYCETVDSLDKEHDDFLTRVAESLAS